MTRVTLNAAAVSALLCAACGGDAAPTVSVTVRDSAGVMIVEHAGDVWAAPPALALAPEPLVAMGAADGDAAYLFDGIRSVVPLSDGRMVVANTGDRTLRWYDADGTFLFQRGGEGGGPGEFDRLGSVAVLSGDSVIALDWAARRTTVFGPDGGLGPIAPLDGLPGPPGTIHPLADGTLVTGISGFSSSQLGSGDEIQPGVYRLDAPLLRLVRGAPEAAEAGDAGDAGDERGAALRADTVGMFPGMDIEVMVYDGGMAFGPPALGRNVAYAAAGETVWVGTANRFEIDAYAPGGQRVGTIRAPDVNLLVDGAFTDAYAAWLRGRLDDVPEDQRAEAERSIAELELPDSLPAYGAFLADAAGNLWVGEYRYDQEPPRRWAVFGADGRLRGTAEMPAGFRPLSITGDRVLGRTADDLGVERVVVYRLVDGGGVERK